MNDLETVAFVNYGNFTSIPVYPAGARGLALHLERLDRDARILFGQGIDGDLVRRRIQEALAGHELPINARVTTFARDTALNRMGELSAPDFIVKIRPMRAPRQTAPRLRSSVYARDLPAVKHVGTFGLFHQVRLANEAGYDDVLFVDQHGEISEGSVWNIGFYDGERVIWPQAPALPGLQMRMLSEQLQVSGIRSETRSVFLSDLSRFSSAFTTNAVGGATPIASIDDVTFEPDPDFNAALRDAHQAIPLEPLIN